MVPTFPVLLLKRVIICPFWQWYHVPLAQIEPAANKMNGPAFCIACVTAYPVTPHPPTGFVPAPAQPATYGGTRKRIISMCFDVPFFFSTKVFQTSRITCELLTLVAGAAPYGVFPNQPQLYAAQGPPPPTYDQTLTHPMVRILYKRYTFLL